MIAPRTFSLVLLLALSACATYEVNLRKNDPPAPAKPAGSKLYVIGSPGDQIRLPEEGPPATKWTLESAAVDVCSATTAEDLQRFQEAVKEVDWASGKLEAGPYDLVATAEFKNTGEGYAASSKEELTVLLHELARSVGAEVIGPHKLVAKKRGEVRWVESLTAYFYRIACEP